MQKLKQIKTFFFDKAQYRIADYRGNKGLLQLDYANNKYRIVGTGMKKSVLKEVEGFAQDLLRRKYGKNFAEEK